jgi:hypothetical protein
LAHSGASCLQWPHQGAKNSTCGAQGKRAKRATPQRKQTHHPKREAFDCWLLRS